MEENPKKQKGSSAFRNATAQPDLRSNEALTQYLDENYTKPPPELGDIFPDAPSLSKLANLIHKLFATSAEKPLSKESSDLCEKGVRHLLNEYKTMKETAIQADTSLGKAKRLVDYAALLAQNPSDITLAKLQILELQRENQEINKSLEDAKAENQSLQQEIDKAINEKIKKANDLQIAQNRHKDDVSQMKFAYAKLEDTNQETNDRLRIDVEEISRMKKQLGDVKAESELNAKEVEALKQRLQQKNEMITKLRTDLKMKEIELQELQIKKEKDELTLSTELLSQSRLLDDKNTSAMKKLARHIVEQTKQIEMLKGANNKASELLEKQNSLLDQFEDEMAYQMNKDNELNEQMMRTRELNINAQEELETTTRQLEEATNELLTLREIVEKSCSNLAPTYIVTQDQLPSVCKELSGTRIDAETSRVLQRLNGIADGLSQFIVKLVRTGHAEVDFLKENHIKVQQSTKSDVFSEIEQIRIFLNTISYSSAEEDKVIAYLINPQENYNFDEDADASLSAVLVTVLSRFREFMNGMLGKLNTVRNVLPAFDCSDFELPSAVADYILQLQPAFNQLLKVIENTLHYHGDMTDIFSCLCKYIEESSLVLNSLDDDVRPLINYNGKIVEIVPHLTNILKEYKDIVSNRDTVQQRELTESLIAADRDHAQYERKVDELTDTINKKERLVNSLQNQLEKINAELQYSKEQEELLTEQNQDLNQQINDMTALSQTDKDAITLLKQQIGRLEATLRERSSSFEKRINDALESERQVTLDTSIRERRRFEEQQAVIEKQITDLNRKLQEEKATVANTIKLYNQQSLEHQATISKIEQEKNDLTTTIEQMRNAPEENTIIEGLQQKLADARMKNRELIAEVSRLTGGNTTNASMDSSYRQSSMRSPNQTRSRGLNDQSSHASPVKDEMSFVDQLGTSLNPFIQKDVVWTRPRIIKTVNALIQRNELLEKNRNGGKNGEWTQWADGLLHHVKPKFLGGITDDEMRQQIGDLTIAAGNRTKLIDMIQILRDEKTALTQSKQFEKSTGEPKLKSFFLVGLFTSLTYKSNPHRPAPSPSRTIKTPASPAAVKSTISMLK